MRTLVIAPHPDDETIGVGATILKRLKKGDKVAWLLITSMNENYYEKKEIFEKEKQIKNVAKAYKFTKIYRLDLPTSQLDTISLKKIIDKLSDVINNFKPNEVFLPHPYDAHSDHKIVFEATSACTKSFRYPFVKKILSYETLSETGYGLKSKKKAIEFAPNYYVDITTMIKRKIKISKLYKTEFKKHPFPRSLESIISNALIRGAESNKKYAEAFELLRIIEE